mmetsp:Transcript_63054/g.119983  ORF Transcript_63054/g.119983 Transcript_63054/m.119983 type:complete len:1307 (+) Transcript_63054:122-4042(+)
MCTAKCTAYLPRWQLLVFVAAAAILPASAEADEQEAGKEAPEQEDLREKDSGFLGADYLHFSYAFEVNQPDAYKQGRGEMWLWHPREDRAGTSFRLRGEAQINGIGNTELILTALPDVKRLYVTLKVEALSEEQCIYYPFPKLEDFPERVAIIKRRFRSLSIEQQTGKDDFSLQWTKSNVLKVRRSADGSFKGIDIQRLGSDKMRTLKSFTVEGALETTDLASLDAGEKKALREPSSHCQLASGLRDDQKIGDVVLRAPNHRSTILNDLLLALEMPDLSHEFVALCAVALPGDTSVVIEPVPPPHLELLEAMSFEYTAVIYRDGSEHHSNGSLWFDLGQRAFRIFGEALHTRLGQLKLDVIAQTRPEAKVYAHAVFPAEGEDECDSYAFPEMPRDGIAELKGVNVSEDMMTFNKVDTVNGEDCGMYSVPMPRGRILYIWVDMEEHYVHGILRVEVQFADQLLRRIDIHRWHSGGVGAVESQIYPRESWHCESASAREDSKKGQLIKFGLHRPHKRSLPLRDTLYAVYELPVDYAVLELLALPGDVAVIVQEPTRPDLSWAAIPGLAFNYSMAMPWIPESAHMGGQFVADSQRGFLRITAGAPGFEQLDIFVGEASLDVQVRPLVDVGKCPDEGYRAYDRCWYVSDQGRTCRETCAARELAFDWAVVNDAEPIMPTLLGFQPQHKDDAWARLECYSPEKHYYRPAKEEAEPDAHDDAREPGDWSDPECRLACPCSAYSYTKDQQCLSFPLSAGDSKQKKLPIPDGGAVPGEFLSVDTFNKTECNVFNYIDLPVASGQGEESMVQLWYSQEDEIARRLELDIGPEATLANVVNLTGWKVSKIVPPVDSVKVPEGWNCRLADDVYHSWLTVAPNVQLAREAWEQPCEKGDCPLAAGAALRSLAQAMGVLHMLPHSAQSLLSRFVAWPPGKRAPMKGQDETAVNLFSPNLESFSFSFSSVFPLQAAEAISADRGGEAEKGRRHGVGELRVDFKKQLLFLRSEAFNVSRGIPYVESRVIYRGDLGQLRVITTIEPNYLKCWSVRSPVLDSARGKPQPNPFERAKLAGKGFSVPSADPLHTDPVKADKYVLHVNPSKRADLFVDEQSRLIAMYLNDLQRDATAGVMVQNWDTEPLDMKLFAFEDEECEGVPYPTGLGGVLAQWDLLSVFFPSLMAEAAATPPPTAAPKAEPADGFTCRPGRGETGFSHLDVSSDNSRESCAERCHSVSGCVAFDVTEKSSDSACRLYGMNAPRADSGIDNRQYCETKPIVDAEAESKTQQRRLGPASERSVPPRRPSYLVEEAADAEELVSV